MARDVNIAFSRLWLACVMDDVRKAGVKGLSKAWVWTSDRRTWEFHFGDFFDCFNASNAYEARAKGWESFLRKTPSK